MGLWLSTKIIRKCLGFLLFWREGRGSQGPRWGMVSSRSHLNKSLTLKKVNLVINCVTWLGVYVTGDNDEENWHQPEQMMLHDEPHNWICDDHLTIEVVDKDRGQVSSNRTMTEWDQSITPQYTTAPPQLHWILLCKYTSTWPLWYRPTENF